MGAKGHRDGGGNGRDTGAWRGWWRRSNSTWNVIVGVVCFFVVSDLGAYLTAHGVAGWFAYPAAAGCFGMVCVLGYRRLRCLWLHVAAPMACLVGAWAIALWWAYLGVASGWSDLLAVACVVAAVSARSRWRQWWCAMARQVLREFGDFDLAEVRRAAGRRGRLFRLWHFVGWTDGSGRVEEALHEAILKANAFFAAVAGRGVPWSGPLRILCFGRAEAFASYARGVWPQHARSGGYYDGLLRKKIVLKEENPLWPVSTLESAAAHEFAHHLILSNLGTQPPPWLGEGLAMLVGGWLGRHVHARGGSQRFLRAMEARGKLLSADAILAMSYRKLCGRGTLDDDAEHDGRPSAFWFQSAGLLGFLYEHHTSGLRAFLAGHRRPRGQAALFRLCFGMSVQEALDASLAECRAGPPASHRLPADDVREWIDRKLVPLVRGGSGFERRDAIRTISALGYAWRADVLIDILEAPGDPMRAEARRALEDIAGGLHGDDPRAWRAWLVAVPWVARKSGYAPGYPMRRRPPSRVSRASQGRRKTRKGLA